MASASIVRGAVSDGPGRGSCFTMAATTLPTSSAAASVDESPPPLPEEPWYSAMAGVIVAGIGLAVLFGIVAVAILTLPDGDTKPQNVVAVSSSAFGVIGTIVGA